MESFANLMPWGTPDQVLRKLEQNIVAFAAAKERSRSVMA